MGLIKSTAMKKIYIYISLVVAASVGYCAGYFLGSHDVILTEDGGLPIVYDVRDALDYEREYADALLCGLHRWYASIDNEIWFDEFMQTDEYKRINKINGGDWEDFYLYESEPLTYSTNK